MQRGYYKRGMICVRMENRNSFAYSQSSFIGEVTMIKEAHSKEDYVVNTKYVINRGTKGHRTLHIHNNPDSYYSRGVF